MTLLKFINIFVLQWFFIRLAYHYEVNKTQLCVKITAHSLIYWIVPCTGWWSDFIVLNGKIKHIYLWNTKSENLKK